MNLAYQMTDQPRSCVNLNGNQVVLRMVASGASALSGLRWEFLSIQRGLGPAPAETARLMARRPIAFR